MNKNPIATLLQETVDAGKLAGVAAGVWKKGQALHKSAVGYRDRESGDAMRLDTLFRIASMSKPVTSTVALMLLEKGRFALDDSITRWAPEFGQMRVLCPPFDKRLRTEAAHRPLTFDDLLTHRSGLTYGPFHSGPLAEAYEVLGGDIDSHLTPDEWIAALASLPLVHQPGTALHYGHSTDLLGLLLERIEDAPLGDILQRHLFAPLGMVDTGFAVPAAQADRKAELIGFDEAGHLTTLSTCPGGSTVVERPPDMSFASGGQGLWSTLEDFGRFARLFAEEGSVDGIRVLQPETLRLMTTNRLTPRQRVQSDVGGMRLFARGHGYGLGVAVVLEPKEAAVTICGGNSGAVGWPGGFGGFWQADPTTGSVMVFLCHNLVEREQFARGVGLDVYQATSEFQELATRLS